jgi:hypothetical protein
VDAGPGAGEQQRRPRQRPALDAVHRLHDQPAAARAHAGPDAHPTPAPGAITYGPYKDITVSMNWNTNVISTAVTGTLPPVLSVKPAKLNMITWAFATGACGSANWGGLAAASVASATCNSYGTAGTWGFTNAFISDLGL